MQKEFESWGKNLVKGTKGAFDTFGDNNSMAVLMAVTTNTIMSMRYCNYKYDDCLKFFQERMESLKELGAFKE